MGIRSETIILGGGPAGLQLGYYLQQQGRDYVILERTAPGAFFATFPRHRELISINKVHTGYQDAEVNLRWDWNSLLCDDPDFRLSAFTKTYFPSADSLLEYLGAFASRYSLNIRNGFNATRVEKTAGGFRLHSDGEVAECDRLVIATGLFRPYRPAIEGIELAQPYVDMPVEPERYAGQRVLIIGKGNSAFETANALVSAASVIHLASPRPVRMAWKTRFVGDLRARNNDFLDTYRLKSQNTVIDGTILRLEQQGERILAAFDYLHAPGEVETIAYDRVLLCAGFRFDSSIFDDSCKPETAHDGKLPRQTANWESTNIPDLFFAGTLTQQRDYKKTMSGFIHGFRYNVRALHHLLEERYHGTPLPFTSFNCDADTLTSAMIRRVNHSSALWQQPGFLCDVWVCASDGFARLHQDLPIAALHEHPLTVGVDYFVATLDFGIVVEDPFNFRRPHRDDAANAAESEALHPVIRHYRDRKLISEHHVMEDLAADWTDVVHVEPLRQYLYGSLGRLAAE